MKNQADINKAARETGRVVFTAEEIIEIIKPILKNKSIMFYEIPVILESICESICREYDIDDWEMSLKEYKQRLEVVEKASQCLADTK